MGKDGSREAIGSGKIGAGPERDRLGEIGAGPRAESDQEVSRNSEATVSWKPGRGGAARHQHAGAGLG